MIQITLPSGKVTTYAKGTKILDVLKDCHELSDKLIVGAVFNQEIRELTYELEESGNLSFFGLESKDGFLFYQRSLIFLLVRAVAEVLPGSRVIVRHSLNKGLYCEIKYHREIAFQDVENIKNRMTEIAAADEPFVRQILPLAEAIELFTEQGQLDKVRLFQSVKKEYISVYRFGDLYNYFYGYMLPSSGYLKFFDLCLSPPGVLLTFPRPENPEIPPACTPQYKMAAVFAEYKKWGEILDLVDVGSLNEKIAAGEEAMVVWIAEALQEKKIAQIADQIYQQRDSVRLITIAGPSSSGKTTFAQRLSVQLRVNGLKPVTISMDDYFVDREKTPLDENGEYDFESIDAVDLPLFNDHLLKLINGQEVEVPIFNFHTGQREPAGRPMKLTDDQILIIEGIHGLNERLTASVPKDRKFKIYVSALTHLNLDEHNRISTTDTRVIRRMVRDSQFRSKSAIETLKRWPSVRRGEERNIFPFQEEADVMFNSALVYELAVLKKYAEPLLAAIPKDSEVYHEAKRLLNFLNYFSTIPDEEVPSTSLLREFIGNSTFYKKRIKSSD